MPQFSYVQSAFSYASSSDTVAYTSDVTEGDLLIAAWGGWGTAAPTGVTDTLGNTWYPTTAYTGEGGNPHLNIWVAIAGSSGANTVTFAGGTGGDNAYILGEYVLGSGYGIFTLPISENNGGTSLTMGSLAAGDNVYNNAGYQAWTADSEFMFIMIVYDQTNNHEWTSSAATVRIESPVNPDIPAMCLADQDLTSNPFTFASPYENEFSWSSGDTEGTVGCGVVLVAAGSGGGGGGATAVAYAA